MLAESFLDTNVLLYACSAAPEDAGKRQRASELILGGDFALSAQVLQEFIALQPPASSLQSLSRVCNQHPDTSSHR